MTFFTFTRGRTRAMVLATIVAALSPSSAGAGAATSDRLAQQTAPAQPAPGTETEAKPSLDSRTDLASMTVELAPRPVAILRGKAEWSEGFKTLVEAFRTLDAAIGSAGLARGGRPFAAFVETDEDSFRFEAMIPLAAKPQGKPALPAGVELGTSPAGKAIKFQHRGPYDEIESTYNLITAFLDEKGLEAQDLFIEEYLTDTKESDDVGLEADIYVFLK
jgi:effector-binding domain-containing protein